LSWAIVIMSLGGVAYLGLDLSERLKGPPELKITTSDLQPPPPPAAVESERESREEPSSPATVPAPAPDSAPKGETTEKKTPRSTGPDSDAGRGSLQIAAVGGRTGREVSEEPAPAAESAPPPESRPGVTGTIAAPRGAIEENAADGAPPPGPMALEVRTVRRSWIWVSCDSRVEIDRRLDPDEVVRLDCLRSIRVSAHDAAAVRLRVNGADCLPLGEEGSRVYGYTIRSDDFHLICRAARGGSDRLP
jgi:hypothetical protein